MTVPIIFRDVDFHIYTISPDCIIRKNGEIIPIDDIIYHSTNGFDYVLLETLSNIQRLYRLEFIMVSSFNPGIQNKWEHFKVIHLDGDIKNCHIDNLTFEEDIEEWREVVYPETVKRGMYAVSSWGRVKNVVNCKFVGCVDNLGYVAIHVSISKRCVKHIKVHRLVAYHFIGIDLTENDRCINHIDGDKTNNHISNIEVVDRVINNQHAVTTGLRSYKSKISTAEIDMVIELLLDPKYSGSIKAVLSEINHEYPHITYGNINDIKLKNPAYIRTNAKYDLANITFPRGTAGVPSKISTAEIDMVIELLLDPKYSGSPLLVYNQIDHDKYPTLNYGVISAIKSKQPVYIRADSKYDIMSINFVKRKNRVTSDDVDMVISMLLDPKYNGSVTRVYDDIDHTKYPEITRDIIAHIKCRDSTYCRIATQYDLKNTTFPTKR